MNNEKARDEVIGLEEQISSILDGEDYSVAMSAMVMALTRVFYTIEHVNPNLIVEKQFKLFVSALDEGLDKFKDVYILKNIPDKNKIGGK